MSYNSFDGETKLFSRMLFIQEDLRFLALNGQVDNLRNFEIETDPSNFVIGEMEGKVLVEGSSGDKEQIDFDTGNILIVLIMNCHFQKLFAKFVLGHLKVKCFINFPLYRYVLTTIVSSFVQVFAFKVKFSPCRTRKYAVALY